MDFQDFIAILKSININVSEEEVKLLKLNYLNDQNQCEVKKFQEHLFTMKSSLRFFGKFTK